MVLGFLPELEIKILFLKKIHILDTECGRIELELT